MIRAAELLIDTGNAKLSQNCSCQFTGGKNITSTVIRSGKEGKCKYLAKQTL